MAVSPYTILLASPGPSVVFRSTNLYIQVSITPDTIEWMAHPLISVLDGMRLPPGPSPLISIPLPRCRILQLPKPLTVPSQGLRKLQLPRPSPLLHGPLTRCHPLPPLLSNPFSLIFNGKRDTESIFNLPSPFSYHDCLFPEGVALEVPVRPILSRPRPLAPSWLQAASSSAPSPRRPTDVDQHFHQRAPS